MSDANPTRFVGLRVTPDPGLELVLDEMQASEELGRPFLVVLECSGAAPRADLHAVLGSSATVTLTHPDKPTRHFNGVVARILHLGLSGGAYRYRLELRPWIWLLSRRQDCAIFSAKSVWTIITTLFRDAGFNDFQDKRQNDTGGAVLDYCVQYRETTLDFVTRLMEQVGLYYYVTHAEGSHTLCLADDPNSHPSAAEAIPYLFDQTDWRSVDDHVWDLSTDAAIEPGATTLREFNFTTPRADLTAKSLIPGGHVHGTSEVYDYPGLYDTADAGTAAARVRMQAREARRQVFSAASNGRGVFTGGRFTLSGYSDAGANVEYLVTRTTCTVSAGETRSRSDGMLVDTFRVALHALPATTPFRLERLTPRPRIAGPQTAIVSGASGEEVTTDQYGRIKVKFPWDRSAGADENSSCWIRVAQVWAGTAWGAIFIPRIGQEVVVEFLEGNPDRPLVTGAVYNAVTTVPYGLPENRTRSTIKSNSSIGGDGFNELRFEDKKGSEEVFLQAQKDLTVSVLNNRTATVTQDDTTTVSKGDRAVTVSEGNDTHTVSEGNRSATVSEGDESLTVSKGNRTVTVSTKNDALTVTNGDHSITVTTGGSTVTAGKSITLKVGGNSITIDTTGITITATKITATANAGPFEASGLTAKVAGSTALELDGGASATLKAAVVAIN